MHINKRINERLRRITNLLLLNARFIDNIGLLSGKMGISIFLSLYARYTNDKSIEEFAEQLVHESCAGINMSTPIDFSNGLLGIGWGVEYLVKNKIMDTDTDIILSDIDQVVYKSMLNNPLSLGDKDDVFGFGHYWISRILDKKPESSTNFKINQLKFLINECQRIFIGKNHNDFNTLQLSVTTVNSILWFLLEMDRNALFLSKVKLILKSILNIIIYNLPKNKADLYILNDLVSKAAISTNYQNHFLFESINNELLKYNSDYHVLDTLLSINLQRLVYEPYIKDSVFDTLSIERALEKIENNQFWNQKVEGLNKLNLGLTGFSGVGLLLLNSIDPKVKSKNNTTKS